MWSSIQEGFYARKNMEILQDAEMLQNVDIRQNLEIMQNVEILQNKISHSGTPRCCECRIDAKRCMPCGTVVI